MDLQTVTAEKLVFGGNSLARINNKMVFIPYAIPGEKLSINIVQHKNDYDNAEIVKILESSEHRVKPACKYYGKCGGCNMMHISPEYQRELRKELLIQTFAQFNMDVKDKVEVVHKGDFNYRSRFQFTNGGLSQKNSNLIIPIENCPCAVKEINDYLKKTPFENRPQGRIHFFGSAKLLNGDTVKYEIPQKTETKKYEELKTRKGKKYKFKENHYFSGTVISEENTVCVTLKNKPLRFDVRGFFQSNLEVFEEVLSIINRTLPGGNNILDMYSGCGSISAFLGEKYNHVTLVEHNRDAIVFAEQNMTGINHTSYGLSGESWVKNCAPNLPAFDACVVDPPRSGMEKAVSDYLCKSKIPFICSLSCDPVTHARDCEKLVKAGYKLKKLFLLDFYPHTSHIESLAIFNFGI